LVDVFGAESVHSRPEHDNGQTPLPDETAHGARADAEALRDLCRCQHLTWRCHLDRASM